MLELEQLQHLIAFYEYKTLSNAAKELHISQPVLTRSMQKLEEELGVSLFTRSKNKISLNETGMQAIGHAKKIIQEAENMKDQLKAFDRSLHTFSIGTCAPAPNIYITQKIAQMYPDKTIMSELKTTDQLIQGLKNNNYTIILMPTDIEDEHIESIPLMEESLYFSLPFNHPLSNRESLSLKEMDGEKMLLMSNIGFWHEMHIRTMPNTKFLIQKDRSVFYDLIELSTLPSFTSDFVMKTEKVPPKRKIIPITDKEAHVTFYCWYLKENESKLKDLLYSL